jgi:hypothetical protein
LSASEVVSAANDDGNFRARSNNVDNLASDGGDDIGVDT